MTKPVYPGDAWDLLSPTLTEHRRNKMQEVIAARTKHIQVVLQDIHDPHNISACLRSAEAFGVLDAHVVTVKEKHKRSTAGRGVQRWLNIHRHDDIPDAVAKMKADGMLLAAGFPDPGATPLEELPTDKPIAVIFGNEHAGIHEEWRKHIDIPFTIPMVGFVESLNISVSCAVTLHSLTSRAQKDLSAAQYFLSDDEKSELLNQWVCEQFPDTFQKQLTRLRETR